MRRMMCFFSARARVVAGLLLGLLLLCGTAGAAGLTGTVDRTTLISGDVVVYVLRLVGGDGREPPDLTPLARDFEIVGQARRGEIVDVDGKRQPANEWLLTLLPRRTGLVTIPALSVSGQRAAPVVLNVLPGTGASLPDDVPLFVRVEAGEVSPYVQSEIPISVRIYDSAGVREGSLSLPVADGATFTQQGEQRNYARTIGKRRYRVIEQNYVMLPQRSGAIEIQPMTLQAKVPGYTGGAMPSDMSHLLGRASPNMPWQDSGAEALRSVTLRSNPVTVEVKARPPEATGWFLPAQAVSLTSAWSKPLAQARVGETLTRTVTLQARGASPNQLPPLQVPDADGVRQYEESSRFTEAEVAGAPGAVLTKTLSVVPTRAGEVTLPAIEVAWWNTETNRQTSTLLPAETFVVAPAPAVRAPVASPAPVAADAASLPKAAAPETAAPAPGADLRAALLAALAGLWERLQGAAYGLIALEQWGLQGWALPLAVLAALGVFFAILRMAGRRRQSSNRRLSRQARRPADPTAAPTAASAERALIAACKANDAVAAHRALLAWQRVDSGPSRGAGPDPVDAFSTADLRSAVADLRQHLYAPAPGGWRGKALASALAGEQRARKRAAKRPRHARLAPLYPEAG